MPFNFNFNFTIDFPLKISCCCYPEIPQRAITQHPYVARQPDELSFEKGETVTIEKIFEDGWCLIRNIAGSRGKAPTNYLEFRCSNFFFHSIKSKQISQLFLVILAQSSDDSATLVNTVNGKGPSKLKAKQSKASKAKQSKGKKKIKEKEA